MFPSQINRIRIQKLTIELRRGRNSKLIIFRNDRNDIPHLTISFENPSKEIDIHLKTRASGGQEHHREIAKVHEIDIAKVFDSFKPILLKNLSEIIPKLKQVRPGWLGRKGYAIFYLDDNAARSLMNRIAPRRKHHSKWERVADLSVVDNYAHSPEAMDNIFHPSVLHELTNLRYNRPVFAGRMYGRHKPKLMPIHLAQKSNGKLCWIRLDKFIKSMMELSETFMLSCLKQILPEDAWTTVYNELHLEEFGIERA